MCDDGVLDKFVVRGIALDDVEVLVGEKSNLTYNPIYAILTPRRWSMLRKMEVYLRGDQADFLRDMAYLESRKAGKRVGVAYLLRLAVDVMIRQRGKKVHKETQAILSSPQTMKDIRRGEADLKRGKYTTDTKKVFDF